MNNQHPYRVISLSQIINRNQARSKTLLSSDSAISNQLPFFMNIENKENSEYKNDRKLSDILLNASTEKKEEVNLNETSSNIFSDSSSKIQINNDVKKDDVQIETSTDTSDELDRIMKKLSAMNNDMEEDNYTNIF